eukprot:299943-Amphidinium_carterae.1
MDLRFDRSPFGGTSGYEPNAQSELSPSVVSPFASASVVPLGGLGELTQQFSLSTPYASRVGTPRTDPQLNWYAGALQESLRRQSEYREEMIQQEANRAQDMLRFQEAGAWVFRQGNAAVRHMDAIRDEAAQQLLSERLRFTSTEVAAQGELGDMNTALAEARNSNNGMELRISEPMVAGREVAEG